MLEENKGLIGSVLGVLLIFSEEIETIEKLIDG